MLLDLLTVKKLLWQAKTLYEWIWKVQQSDMISDFEEIVTGKASNTEQQTLWDFLPNWAASRAEDRTTYPMSPVGFCEKKYC